MTNFPKAMPSPLTVAETIRRGSRTFLPGARFPWHQMALSIKSVRALIDKGYLVDPFAPAAAEPERELIGGPVESTDVRYVLGGTVEIRNHRPARAPADGQ